jgi:histidinol-phosphate aminotransferase
MGLGAVIKLASNENCLGPSPLAIKAMTAALTGLGRYGDADSRRFRQALADKLKAPVNQILAGNGSSEFILLLSQALLSPGLNAVMSRPSFTLYASNAKATGAEAIEVPVTKGYGHDLEAMLAKVDQRTRLVFLDNPLNPTGAWVTAEDLTAFSQKLPDNALLFLDEAYTDYSRLPRPDYSALLATGRVAIARTFSKNYGLAGIRAAYLLANPDLIQALNKFRQPFNLNLLAQVGATAALEDEEHLINSQKAVWEGIDYFNAKLPPLGLPTHPTQANFILAGPVAMGAEALDKALLKKGFIIRSLNSFGLPNHVRISVGTPAENAALVQALTQILS